MTKDGQFILSGSNDKSIKLWSFKTKQLIHHFKEAHNGNKPLMFSHCCRENNDNKSES